MITTSSALTTSLEKRSDGRHAAQTAENDLPVTSKRGIERLGRGGFFQLVDPSNDSPIMGKDQSHAPGQLGLPATLTSPFSFLRPPFSLFRRDGDGSGMRGESSKGGGSSALTT